MDPLTMIFVPGGLLFGAAVVLVPVGAIARAVWKRRGQHRNRAGTCAACGAALVQTEERYHFTGLLTCGPCAMRWRRRLSVALPAVAGVAALFAITSGAALVTSIVDGGPGLSWWLDGRFIPLLMPSVGLGAIAAWIIARSKRANQIAAGHAITEMLGEGTGSLARGALGPRTVAHVDARRGEEA